MSGPRLEASGATGVSQTQKALACRSSHFGVDARDPDGETLAARATRGPSSRNRHFQRLRLARLDSETINAASRAVLARYDVAGAPPELHGAARCRRRSV